MIYLTGASGFLGQHVRAAMPDVVPLARDATIPLDATALLHFAAVIPGHGISDDEAGDLTWQMDERWCQRALVARIPVVYASTAHPPDCHYREAKHRTTSFYGSEFAITGIPFASLLISAPYGPGQTRPTVIRTFMEKARAGEPLTYHGTGTREQDFIYATDVARAASLALGQHGAFPVVSGQPVTMRALAHMVVAAIGSESSVCPSGKPDPQEGQTVRFDPMPTFAALGWRPEVSLARGLATLA